jgi:hypothetical protein
MQLMRLLDVLIFFFSVEAIFWIFLINHLLYSMTIAVVNLTLIDLPGLTKVAIGMECLFIYIL